MILKTSKFEIVKDCDDMPDCPHAANGDLINPKTGLWTKKVEKAVCFNGKKKRHFICLECLLEQKA